jgi:hypothetical protein
MLSPLGEYIGDDLQARNVRQTLVSRHEGNAKVQRCSNDYGIGRFEAF